MLLNSFFYMHIQFLHGMSHFLLKTVSGIFGQSVPFWPKTLSITFLKILEKLGHKLDLKWSNFHLDNSFEFSTNFAQFQFQNSPIFRVLETTFSVNSTSN